ncbi:unnamed protein product [Phyllotreta striolata]|uniref:Uncharacterized protein n=1 Tax=Phyllotreta striolata TaxID=444603 RepID=A0A9N9TFY1_PHYSR|nr:unnamed protein product [Phyllotreta striolata]
MRKNMLSFGVFPAVFLPLFLSLSIAKSAEDVTFRDVTFETYKLYEGPINRTIRSGDKIADFLSKDDFHFVKIKGQNVPVLRRNSLADLRIVSEIVVEESNVEEIQAGFLGNSTDVKLLSLKGNRITSIEYGVFNNLELISIDLTSNKIASIDSRAFDDMPSLITLRLDDNLIADWNPNWFKNTPLLAVISMQRNRLEEIPADAFGNLKGDKRQEDIDFNVSLAFSYNRIKTIHPEAFSGLEKIHSLWFDHNRLDDFDGNLLTGIRVGNLRLNHNEIKCFKSDLDKVLTAENNYIDSNPFDCECLERIKAYSKTSGKKVHIVMAEMDCVSRRIQAKMAALENRLKELKLLNRSPEIAGKKEVEDVEVFDTKKISIK